MPRFGKTSRKRLATCHPKLQKVFKEVVKEFDCSVICGHRNEKDQNKAFNDGRSKVKYPHGRHNATPSNAIDVAPYPIDWNDRERFTYFAGYVLGIAKSMGITLRWGGDWNRNWDLKDNNFDDLPHFEIKE
tara:strand:- start:4017 stop:4409 length:393 start_codon:yes stop_codon:yes gene_type:complete